MLEILRKQITIQDIKIEGKHIEDDKTNAGYNIGDLLNIPSLAGYWRAVPHNRMEDLERLYIIGSAYYKSILSYYIEARPTNEIVPCIPRVIGAVQKFIENTTDAKDYLQFVQSEDVLCVHIRCGDKNVEQEYLDLIIKLSKNYRFVYLFCGLHLDARFSTNNEKTISFLNTINFLLANSLNISLVNSCADMHVALMMKSKNLLLHKGGYSTIGLIICEGNIFITKLLDTVNDFWKARMNIPYTFLELQNE